MFACSLDGKIATRTGESRWISGQDSRRRVHELRDTVDAILVGAGTAIADDPLLTTRLDDREGHHPLRLVLDSRGRVPLEVRLFDLVICLSDAADLVSRDLVNHHKQTAYIAWQIGEAMGLPRTELLDLTLAGMVHDMGALPLYESLDSLLLEKAELLDDHAKLGCTLISSFEPLSRVGELVRHHHAAWRHGKGQESRTGPIPRQSFILHLADRISVGIKADQPILAQAKQLREQIHAKSGGVFWPEAVEAFEDHSAADARIRDP